MSAPTELAEAVALSGEEWRARQRAYADRVEPLVAPHEVRRARGQSHPVEDFLFMYYVYRPNQLRRWHPGAEVALRGADDAPHRDWPHYRFGPGGLGVDIAGFAERRRGIVLFVRRLMRSTLDRAGSYSCFGAHEWAMVYRQSPAERRHDTWPLRADADRIAAVVEQRPLVCTHVDAFRFFTDAARPLNHRQLQRDDQLASEQPGCLHAGMDLYKWAYKLVPITSSDLVLDCFELARRIRYVDMQASPYDLSALGVEPIEIDTVAGRTTYTRKQREFAAAAAPLRRRLLAAVDLVIDHAPHLAGRSTGIAEM